MKTVTVNDEQQMKRLGQSIGEVLVGGECFELIGDVGAGKTTFTKGLGMGLGITEDVQSPSFTLSRVYEARDGLSLEHYDFYRLQEPGILSYELDESLKNKAAVTVIEWAETVADTLPAERITITFSYSPDGEARQAALDIPQQYASVDGVIK